MAIIGFEIEKCNECPLHRTERTITADSFEYANYIVFQNGVH